MEDTKESLVLYANEPELAIRIMQKTASYAREHGLLVWSNESLTAKKLITKEALPENFYVGRVQGKEACAFILQSIDTEYWAKYPAKEAMYLHKLCVLPEFNHQNMTKRIVQELLKLCHALGIPYLRLDTSANKWKLNQLYQQAGFSLVDIITQPNGHQMSLYQRKVE